MKEYMQLEGESPMAVDELQVLSIAEGTVDPAVRVASGEVAEGTILELVDRVKTDEFYDEIPADSIPCKCMDCRRVKQCPEKLGGNAAGGTFTLVIADALTTNNYRREGENSATHAKRLLAELKKEGHVVGGHDADAIAGSENCGCGAEDKLDSADEAQPSILRYLTRRGDDVRGVVESLGFAVSDEVHAALIARAQELRDQHYAANGAEVRDATIEAAGEDAVETLCGPQLAVVAVINTQAGTSLNRDRVAEAFGDDYQVFNIDAPTIIKGAEATSLSPEEAQLKTIAALYYNVATAGVIVGPSMPVVVR